MTWPQPDSRVEASGDNKPQRTLGCTFDLDVGDAAIGRTVQLTLQR